MIFYYIYVFEVKECNGVGVHDLRLQGAQLH